VTVDQLSSTERDVLCLLLQQQRQTIATFVFVSELIDVCKQYDIVGVDVFLETLKQAGFVDRYNDLVKIVDQQYYSLLQTFFNDVC